MCERLFLCRHIYDTFYLNSFVSLCMRTRNEIPDITLCETCPVLSMFSSSATESHLWVNFFCLSWGNIFRHWNWSIRNRLKSATFVNLKFYKHFDKHIDHPWIQRLCLWVGLKIKEQLLVFVSFGNVCLKSYSLKM